MLTRRQWFATAVPALTSLPGALSATLAQGVVVSDESSWPPLRESELSVESGSALDFSSLVEPGPAGRQGWATRLPGGAIGFERRRQPQRFFSGSFQFAPGNGGMPDHDEARRIVTQLVRTGYNAVRLQCVEAHLMSGRTADFDFEPTQFDRFLFLLAELKAQGVYVVIDVAYIDNGAWGNVFPHRWVKKFNFRRDLYTVEAAQLHWRQLLKTMLGRRNPYSGTVPLEDPAMLALVLCNEGGVIELAFREGGGWAARVPGVYAEPFRTWLQSRYEDEAAWRRAWGGEAGTGESLQTRVAPPERWRTSGPRQRDFMQFVARLEQDTYRWMHDAAEALGFKGLTTAYNNWNWLHSDISRSSTSMVDMHAYHAHPTAFVSPGSRVTAESSLPRALPYLRELGASRQWGRPFTVTEYGHAFWNGWRREASALAPAYAALQGWDLLTQFSENSLQLSLKLPQPGRRAAIFPFTISTDPIRRSGERLAALLYARGDVAPARGRIEFRIDADRELQANGAWSQLNETASRMMFVTGIGLGIGVAAPSPALVLADSGDFLVDKSGLGYQILAGIGSPLRRKLTAGRVVTAADWADIDRGRLRSDTGELDLDTAAGRFTINTPRTLVWLGPAGDGGIAGLVVAGLSVPALVAASSLDGQRVEASRRLLLFLLTDATNTGIEFDDAARTRLRALGGLPARVRPARLTLSLKSAASGLFRLYALAQNGQRVEELPVRTSDGTLHMSIDTAALRHGPALLFELVAA